MRVSVLVAVLAMVAWRSAGQTTPSGETTVEKMKSIARQISRQLMLQQLYVEEKTRSEGDSGIKQIRFRRDGSKPYYTSTWSSTRSVAAIHDHSDHVRTVGMGELTAVLNGVEFRTRHNDYKLRMASTNSSDYHATEEIPYPDVPPAVAAKASVDEQVAEMREWFRAWKTSNSSHRPYEPYFKAALCYLEGSWTLDRDLDEPFDSDRHELEAASWFDLQEKIRYTGFTGDKNINENLAYLPTTIMDITEDGEPIFGQWNYRILCHPLESGDLPLKDIRPLEALASRLAAGNSFEEYLTDRTARFSINPYEEDQPQMWGLLDKLMNQVPGKDNYMARIRDESFGLTKYKVDNPLAKLNVGFYNRWYRVKQEGAMGSKTPHKGYADRNLFVAETTQTRVAPMSLEVCKGRGRRKTCTTTTKRVSYAIPLEIVYMTPLQTWNPFDIEYKGDAKSELGKTVTAGGRNGKPTPEKALNGINSKDYYLTPTEFFSGAEVGSDPADTAGKSVGVLDRDGQVRLLKASGIRIMLPEIKDLGIVRTRYPIMPVHAEGSPVWKELEALRDVVMNMQKYTRYFQVPPGLVVNETAPQEPEKRGVSLATSSSNPFPVGLHAHKVELTAEQAEFLQGKPRRRVTVTTSEENGHSHTMKVRYDKNSDTYMYTSCDSSFICFDGHNRRFESQINSFLAP